VNDHLGLFAEIDIVFLRPGEPGKAIQGGDVDNRLKTLFDALRRPLESNQIPNGVVPQAGEDPFFCLLEDDQLISKISVCTDRLLDSKDANEVVLLLHVVVRGLEARWCNISLIA
jgi:hypothetical protein